MIYPVDSVIKPSDDWGLVFSFYDELVVKRRGEMCRAINNKTILCGKLGFTLLLFFLRFFKCFI